MSNKKIHTWTFLLQKQQNNYFLHCKSLCEIKLKNNATHFTSSAADIEPKKRKIRPTKTKAKRIPVEEWTLGINFFKT